MLPGTDVARRCFSSFADLTTSGRIGASADMAKSVPGTVAIPSGQATPSATIRAMAKKIIALVAIVAIAAIAYRILTREIPVDET